MENLFMPLLAKEKFIKFHSTHLGRKRSWAGNQKQHSKLERLEQTPLFRSKPLHWSSHIPNYFRELGRIPFSFGSWMMRSLENRFWILICVQNSQVMLW